MGSTLITLQKYLSAVQAEFARARLATKPDGVHVLKKDEHILVDAVESLELSGEFRKLADSSDVEFYGGRGKADAPIQMYLRLSRAYQEIFAGEPISAEDIWSDFSMALSRRERTVTYIAPIAYVNFVSSGPVDCGSFQLRRFSQVELDSLLRNDVKKVFFPWAYVDTEEVQSFWCASAKQTMPIDPSVIKLTFDLGFKPTFSRYPAPVEEVLRQLALYDWDSVSKTKTIAIVEGHAVLARPYIPFVISVSDLLTELPDRGPDLTGAENGLSVGPVLFRWAEEGVPFDLDESRTVQFATRMGRLSEMTMRAKRFNPGLVETILGFLLKALTSYGLEELLWHITAIEAAVGEEVDGGLTKLLRTRVSRILGRTEGERKAIRRRFSELYDLRSNLVHGNDEIHDQKVKLTHFLEARRFSRAVVLWTLCYLSHAQHVAESEGENALTREDILHVLDMDERTRPAVTRLLRRTPQGFPNIDEWLF